MNFAKLTAATNIIPNDKLDSGIVLVGGWSIGGWFTGGWFTGGWFTGGWLTGGWFTGGWLTGGWLTGGWLTGGWFTGGWLIGGRFTGGVTVCDFTLLAEDKNTTANTKDCTVIAFTKVIIVFFR